MVLVLLALGALVGLPQGFVTGLTSVADATGFFWARRLVARALAKVLSLDDHVMHELGVACLAYAAVFTVEGVGLVLRKPWAEWLTVIVTSSFVPLEVYELVHRPGWGKVVAVVVNVAIVVYLIVRIRWRRKRPWR